MAAVAREIVVLGGGIGGVETALTLALGLPDATVTLVARWPSLRLRPDFVYMPFGVSPRRIDLPLNALERFGVHVVIADVERVDADAKQLVLDHGTIDYDVLVASPGAVSAADHSLRTLDDAMRIRRELQSIATSASDGVRRRITIHVGSDDSWSAPASEFAILLGAWSRAHHLGDHVHVLLETPDRELFSWFGTEASDVVNAALRRFDIHVATGVPSGRHDQLDADMSIDFGSLAPREINGLPGRGSTGWYKTDSHGAVAPDVYVIGDATTLPYRAGFATAWQARRVLEALGGDLSALGEEIGGIPIHEVEYQMDLADGVMRARVGRAESLAHPFLGHVADVEIEEGARPDKLVGLLLYQRLLDPQRTAHDAPQAFRDELAVAARNG